jgi:hypothetical protein
MGVDAGKLSFWLHVLASNNLYSHTCAQSEGFSSRDCHLEIFLGYSLFTYTDYNVERARADMAVIKYNF